MLGGVVFLQQVSPRVTYNRFTLTKNIPFVASVLGMVNSVI